MGKFWLTKEEFLAKVSELPDGCMIVGTDSCQGDWFPNFDPSPNEHWSGIYYIGLREPSRIVKVVNDLTGEAHFFNDRGPEAAVIRTYECLTMRNWNYGSYPKPEDHPKYSVNRSVDPVRHTCGDFTAFYVCV